MHVNEVSIFQTIYDLEELRWSNICDVAMATDLNHIIDAMFIFLNQFNRNTNLLG